MAQNERVTLCWNRQVVSNNDSTPTTIYAPVDLDLSVYDESDGSAEGSSASGVNSVEQVKVASTLSSPVIKVKRGSYPNGVTAQDFSVAAEDAGTLSSVAAPSLTAVYTASPTLLTGNTDFTVTVRVDNGGGLPAFAPSVTLTLPSGYSIQSGANPQTLSTINGSASASATWTVRSASSGTSGSRTLQVAASSSSYGETWATGTVASNHDLDLQAPTGTVTIAGGADFVKSTSVDLVVSASDDLSGAAEMRFSNDGTTFSDWEELSPTKSWVMASGSDGARTVRAQFRDTAGNQSGSFTDDTTLDTAAPSGTVVAAGDAAWTNTRSITLTLSASDSLSGMSMMRFGSDGVTWRPWAAYATSASFLLPAGDGDKTVYAEFQDVAGNVSTAVTDGIGLDTALPSGTVTIAGGATYTTTGNVSLGLSASDALSGVTDMRFSNDGTTWGPWTAYATSTAWALTAGDGAKTVQAEFRDAAGNVSSPAASDGITRDGTPPTGSLSIDGGSTATNSTGVTLGITSSDPVSGVTLMRLRNGTGAFGSWIAIESSLPWTLPSGDSSKTVGIQFSDAAGNVSSEATDSILLDQTAPTGSVAILNGRAAINGTAVTVDVGYSDNLSGVALVRLSNDGVSWGAWTGPASPLDWDLAPGEGTRTVHYQMRDVAGNLSVAISDTIQLDTTLPTGSFVLNGGQRYLLGAFPLVAQTTSDDGASGSGVVELRVSHDAGDTWSEWLPIGTGEVEIPRPAGRGLRTVRGEFRDLAGNSSAAFDGSIHLVEDAPQSLSSAKKVLGSLPAGGDVDSFVVDLVAGDALSLKGKAKAAQKGIKVALAFDLHSPSGAPIFTGRYPAELKAPGVSKFVATETGPHTVVLRTEGTDMDAAATYSVGVKVAAAKTNLSFAGTTATGVVPFTAARGGTVSGKLTGNVVPPVLVAPPSGVPEIVDILTKGTVHSLVPAALDGPTGGWEIRFASAGSVTYAIKVKPAKRLVVPEDPDAALPQ
jgi:hypothetical protein